MWSKRKHCILLWATLISALSWKVASWTWWLCVIRGFPGCVQARSQKILANKMILNLKLQDDSVNYKKSEKPCDQLYILGRPVLTKIRKSINWSIIYEIKSIIQSPSNHWISNTGPSHFTHILVILLFIHSGREKTENREKTLIPQLNIW